MASPAAMGIRGGGGGEWVLTDSAFHIGGRACNALVRLAASHPEEFSGVEVCAYGDFMQPLGTHPVAAYLTRVDHVASLAGSGSAEDQTPAGQLRRARELVAGALRGCPLLVLPILPSRQGLTLLSFLA